MKTKVLLALGVFLILWSVASALGISSFGTWFMPILIGIILISIIFPEFLPERMQSFGPYPIGKESKWKLMQEISNQETKILNKMDILRTLFFPLSFGVGVIFVILLKQPVEDPYRIIEHDARIVSGIIITLMAYIAIIIIGYLILRSWSKKLDDSWENKKHLSFFISISK